MIEGDMAGYRFIPTRVGNTPCLQAQSPAGDGSSPRAWGTQRFRRQLILARRFIPTRVGNTVYRHSAHTIAAVHPHARGEHTGLPRLRTSPDGSSPRAWGTHHLHHAKRVQFAVHPHARGEHPSRMPRIIGIVGSSPRAWGTHFTRFSASGLSRFIPTRVGNTGQDVCGLPIPPVHPHARGEHWSAANCRNCPDGSSPRAWGTPPLPAPFDFPLRFIPTRVGNT